MSQGSLTPLTCYEPPPGLVGSHFLGDTQMQQVPAGDDGTEARHVVSRRSMRSAQIARSLAPLPDAKRPSRVGYCQKSVIRCPTPQLVSCLKNATVSESLEELAREVAREHGHPLAKEEGSKSSHESGTLLVPTSALLVFGSRHHRLRTLIDHLMRRDGAHQFFQQTFFFKRFLSPRGFTENNGKSLISFFCLAILPVWARKTLKCASKCDTHCKFGFCCWFICLSILLFTFFFCIVFL